MTAGSRRFPARRAAIGATLHGTGEFRILGPLEVAAAGGSLEVSGPKERVVMAVLATRPGQLSSADLITDALWGDSPPRSSTKVVQNLVLRLRRVVGTEVIETRPGGYRLRATPDDIDAWRFERLIREGRERVAQGEVAAGAAALSAAVDLWRGTPLPELADWPAVRGDVARLEELYRGAAEDLADIAISAGQHREWVARLETMVAEEPLRERRWELLMVALYRCGRQADALRAYQRARIALGELGLEPGPDLRETERAVSGRDERLALGRPSADEPARPTGVVTFLLTDVEGSSTLWERSPQETATALERHDAVIADAVTDTGGVLLKARGEGDSSFSVFSRTSAAIAAAVAIRDALDADRSPDGVSLAVRLALHTGEAHERGGDYYGPTVNRAARLRALAAGGQIVLSEAVASIARDDLPDGLDLVELGEQALEGLTRPERVFTLVSSGAILDRGARVIARSCPYMGLLTFQPDDDRLFFGREAVVENLTGRLARRRFVALVGASGSGKSSLLRAGLVAALRRSGPEGTSRWVTVLLTPGGRPLAALAAHLAPLCGASVVSLLHDLEADPRALDAAVRQAVASRPPDTRVALVVDQLEELWTQGHDENEVRRFIDGLVDAAGRGDSPVDIVVGLRADFFGRGAQHDGLARLLEAHTVLLGAMDGDGLRAAIERPARVAGLTVQPGLVDLMIRDVTGEPGGLPLLSHALLEAWARRRGRTLTVDGYRDSGGVSGAIGRTADAVFESLDRDQQHVARALLLRLTEPGEGTEDTRRRAPLDELTPGGADRSPATLVLEALAAARLVTVSDEGVEIAHEALIREWPRLRDWLDEDRQGLRTMRHLTHAAKDWAERGRDESDLYRGARLATASTWRAAGHDADLSPVEREFLDAAQGRAEAERRAIEERVRAQHRSNRLLRGLLTGTAVALVVALVAGGLAVSQRDRADEARGRADAAAHAQMVSGLATLARTLPSSQIDLALLLGVEAHRLAPTIETEGALETALVHAPPGLDRVLPLEGGLFPDVSPDGRIVALPQDTGLALVDLATGRRLPASPDGAPPALVAQFSRDGQLVASGGTTGQVDVWDVATGRRSGAPLTPRIPAVLGVFDPADADTIFIVSSGVDPRAARAVAEVTQWDRRDPDHPIQVGEPFPFSVANALPIVALSSDGTRLATGGSYGGTTEVWDVASHARLATWPGAPGTFVPGGHVIPISQPDRIDLWDADSGSQVGQPLTGFSNAVGGRVSSDGRHLAVLDGAHGVRVFDLSTRQPVGPPVGLDTGEAPVGFLPGGRLAVWGQSGLTVWRPGTLAPPMGTVVGDHGGSGTGARVHGAFVAGSDDVLTAAVDAERDLQLWDSRTGTGGRPVLAGQVRSRAGVSADGALLAGPTADRDAIGVWDLAGATLEARIPTSSPAQAAVWAPTGSLLATAETEQAVRLWDLSDPNHPHPIGRITAPGTPPEGNEPELYPYFSDDGRRIALVDNPGETVTVFDVAARRQLWTRHLGSLQQVAFSPDGRTLAVLTDSVRLLDAATGEQGRSFPVPGAGAVGLQYVRGGSALAATTLLPASALAGAANAAGALLWDVETLEPIGSPMPLGLDGTAQIARDEEGARMITGSTSGRAVVWDLDVDHWEDAACRLAGRNLTRDEWARYLPTQPYRETCPQQA